MGSTTVFGSKFKQIRLTETQSMFQTSQKFLCFRFLQWNVLTVYRRDYFHPRRSACYLLGFLTCTIIQEVVNTFWMIKCAQ